MNMNTENFEEKYKAVMAEEEAYLRAKKRLDQIKGFFWHAVSYLLVNIFLLVVIAVNLDDGDSFWTFGTFATPFFWGIGLFFHGLGVFGFQVFFGRDWEERKIKEFLEKEKRNTYKYK